MRRHRNLYPGIISFQNLLLASRLAQRGKRFKDSAARFNFHLERELWRLHHELAEKRYKPGKYHHFRIYEPKERLISAAPYRDRVVHHAIHNILEPIFEPLFIYDSYATRKGKGAHAAIDRFQEFAHKSRYVLKCDVQKYFPSVDRDILLGLIERKVACADTIWLIKRILDSSQEMVKAERTLHPSFRQVSPSAI
ncbi:MAG: Retron-type reverse transcriptase [Deltaproteobacteria bacterium]|nr:Retron-type reverse transcriptase [Deltaproteobacteria bacterium]